MTEVLQCDGCQKIIDPSRRHYSIDLTATVHLPDTYETPIDGAVYHACSDKCLSRIGKDVAVDIESVKTSDAATGSDPTPR